MGCHSGSVGHADSGPSAPGQAPRCPSGSPSSPRASWSLLTLVARGRSNSEIAAELFLSEPTVKKHVGRILEKLGLADRLQAGLYLARNPLLFRSEEATV